MATAILELDGAGFERVRAREGTVLVTFWAPWCASHRSQDPILEDLLGRLQGRAVLARVDISAQPDLAEALRILAIPTHVILREGRIRRRLTGVQDADALLRAVLGAGRRWGRA